MPELLSADAEPDAAVRRTPVLAQVVGLIVVFLVIVAGIVLAVRATDDGPSRAAAIDREQVLVAARTFVTNLTTYDYQRIDQDVARVAAGATGHFKEEYSLASGAEFQKLVKTNKAVAQGTVLSAGIVAESTSCQDDPDGEGPQTAGPARPCLQAVVLLAVDQQVTNSNTPTPRVDRNRIQVTLERIGETWLASKVDVL